VSAAPVYYRPPRHPHLSQALSALVGLLGVGAVYIALRLWEAYQAYSSFLVQAVTGRDGAVYGLYALFFAAGSVALFYGSWQLWKQSRR